MKQLNDALHKARVPEEQIRVTRLLDHVLHYKTDVSHQLHVLNRVERAIIGKEQVT